jgi:hypothetical protein
MLFAAAPSARVACVRHRVLPCVTGVRGGGRLIMCASLAGSVVASCRQAGRQRAACRIGDRSPGRRLSAAGCGCADRVGNSSGKRPIDVVHAPLAGPLRPCDRVTPLHRYVAMRRFAPQRCRLIPQARPRRAAGSRGALVPPPARRCRLLRRRVGVGGVGRGAGATGAHRKQQQGGGGGETTALRVASPSALPAAFAAAATATRAPSRRRLPRRLPSRGRGRRRSTAGCTRAAGGSASGRCPARSSDA